MEENNFSNNQQGQNTQFQQGQTQQQVYRSQAQQHGQTQQVGQTHQVQQARQAQLQRQLSICPKCGKQNQIGSQFCNECGTELPKIEDPVEKSNKRAKTIGIVVACVAVVALVIIAIVFINNQNAHKGHSVKLIINSQEYSTGNASRIPISVKGADLDQNEVNEIFYIDEKGEGIELKSGYYSLNVLASPLSESGTYWSLDSKELSANITKDLPADASYDGLINSPIKMTVMDPAKISEKDVEISYELMKKDDKFASKADAYKEATLKAMGKAGENAKAAAELLAKLPVGNWNYTGSADGYKGSMSVNNNFTATIKDSSPGQSENTTSFKLEVVAGYPTSTSLGTQCFAVRYLKTSGPSADRYFIFVKDKNKLFECSDSNFSISDEDAKKFNSGECWSKV